MALKLKYEIAELVEQMYRETDRIIEPLYPWVLVRPLPRSAVTASKLIVMPDVQNKPNLESIVLVTWKPFWENVEKENTKTGDVLKVRVWNESDLKPGDHIIHPHHVGLPDSFLDEKTYRLIREEDASSKLHYHDENWLRDEITHYLDGTYARPGSESIADDLLKLFDIVPKHGYQSLTTSGA